MEYGTKKGKIKALPTRDRVFRHLMVNFFWLRMIIASAILKVEPKDVREELTNETIVVQAPEFTDDKESVFDYCAIFNDIYYIIEMQKDHETGFHKRLGYYGHALGSRLLNSGQDYRYLPSIIIIAFLDHVYFSKKGLLVEDISIIKDTNLDSGIPIYYFQLPKFDIDLKKASMFELILAFFAAKTWERLYEIQKCWNSTYGDKKGGDLMNELCDALHHINSDKSSIKDFNKSLDTQRFEALKAQAKAQLKAKDEEIKALRKAKDEELKAELKAELEAQLKPLTAVMEAMMDRNNNKKAG